MYGYKLTLPPSWVAISASQKFSGAGEPPAWEDPHADNFYYLGPATYGSLGFAWPTTDDLAAFTSRVVAASAQYHSDTCPAAAGPTSTDPVTVGGEPGSMIKWNCGILINIAVTVHNGTGYNFIFRDPAVEAASNDADAAVFQQLLDSVIFLN
jgi:hypothetical protein